MTTLSHPREAIARLCLLAEEAAQVIGYEEANDCFCGEGGFWLPDEWPNPPRSWRHAGQTIEFIETAVRRAIAQKKAVELAASFADVEVRA